MSIKMEGLDGIAATKQIIAAFPEAQIMIVTDYDDAELLWGTHIAPLYCGFHARDLTTIDCGCSSFDGLSDKFRAKVKPHLVASRRHLFEGPISYGLGFDRMSHPQRIEQRQLR